MTLRTWAILGGLLAALSAGAAPDATAESVDLKIETRSVELPSFRLLAHTGEAFDDSELRDRWSLVFIGYTYCPDVCPTMLYDLTNVLESIEARYPAMPLPQVVFVSVDGERDRDLIAEYVGNFHPTIIGVTGDAPEIDKLVHGMQAFYSIDDKEADGQYLVQHSATVNVVDPTGRIVARLNPPVDPDLVADGIINLMRGS